MNVLIWKSDVSQLRTPAPKPTIIYGQNGEMASKIAQSSIEGVSLEKIPDHTIQAVISTEDQNFYKHNGLNYFGIGRALFQNIASGEVVAGGSTITQQLAKNVFLTQDRTLSRKFREMTITKKIERSYSKDEILERYLNHIYYGEGAWGIQKASKTYFGKDVSELTLNESALLAGLIKAPSVLSPVKNMDQSIERRNLVLSLMVEEGYITEDEFKHAKNERVVLDRTDSKDTYKGNYPYYVDHVIDEAINKYDLTENEVLSGGLKIYTELNPTIQQSMEEVFKDDSMFPESQPDQMVQSGGVFINPSTGGVNALVGGRGEHTYRGFNRATQLIRQPGSTMKPLAVYTPALEQGYDIFDPLKDQPINIDGYQPQNYDHQYRGQTTMYEALIHSYNVPAVWLLNQMGVQYGIDALERFDIPLEEEDHHPGIALGGMTKGTSPLTMAQAYSTFPNNGQMVEAHSIVKIEDSNGEILGEWKDNATQVMEPETAQKITYMLKGVVEEGTGTGAQVNGFEVAGKTGTTEVPLSTGNRGKDHWFVGYTAGLTGAVWLGYDQTDEEHYLSSSSSKTATKVFAAILSKSTSQLKKKTLDLPLAAKLDKDKDKKEERKKEEEEKAEKSKKKERKKQKEDKKKKDKKKKRDEKDKKKEKAEDKKHKD
nr:PBP1A family penicillin-binding protein [Halobacillus litoralis]